MTILPALARSGFGVAAVFVVIFGVLWLWSSDR